MFCLISFLRYNIIMLKKYQQILTDKGEVYIRIKVRPGASKTGFKAIMDDETIKIDVAAVPENGRANEELIGFLAQELGVDKNNVKILSGAADHLKLVKIIKL